MPRRYPGNHKLSSASFFYSEFLNNDSFTHSQVLQACPYLLCLVPTDGLFPFLFSQGAIWVLPLVQSPGTLSHSKTVAVFTACSFPGGLSRQSFRERAGQSSLVLAPTAAPSRSTSGAWCDWGDDCTFQAEPTERVWFFLHLPKWGASSPKGWPVPLGWTKYYELGSLPFTRRRPVYLCAQCSSQVIKDSGWQSLETEALKPYLPHNGEQPASISMPSLCSGQPKTDNQHWRRSLLNSTART